MLEELRVENLLLLDEAQIRLAPGLNVVTGETGAGKTLLAQALDLLLGGRAGKGLVREGASEAYVEGIFRLDPGLRGGPERDDELIPPDAQEVVLARRVWPDGRTRAYVCGRSATVGDLRDLGGRLLAFYGQHEHRKLMLGAAQLDILDFHCGPGQSERRARTAQAWDRVRRLEDRVEELRELARARERELDLLAFELREIESAGLSEDEKERLVCQRDRLRHVGTLTAAGAGAAGAIGGEDGAGVADRLIQAVLLLEPAVAVDPQLAALAERLESLRHECDDVQAELHAYTDRLVSGQEDAGSPELRVQEVEERLAVIARLERKHGGSVGQVLAHAERCRDRMNELEQAEVSLEAAEAELTDARTELAGLAAELSRHRRRAAPSLAAAVRKRLVELAMPEASFEVVLSERPGGPGPRGTDAIKMVIATSPGIAAGPLREVASGGELSRVMLALLSVAHGRAGPSGERAAQPLLVFDEVDAGIGGHTAHAVGEHLRALADGRQVLCITHLPQVAALAARHFTIAKDTRRRPARTTVTTLQADGVVGELVRMLGADAGDRAAGEHARHLLRAAA